MERKHGAAKNTDVTIDGQSAIGGTSFGQVNQNDPGNIGESAASEEQSAMGGTSFSQTNPGNIGENVTIADEDISHGIPTRNRKIRTRYVCVCNRIFTTQKQIKDHISAVHSGDKYVCTICLPKLKTPERAWFSTKEALIDHCYHTYQYIRKKYYRTQKVYLLHGYSQLSEQNSRCNI